MDKLPHKLIKRTDIVSLVGNVKAMISSGLNSNNFKI